MNFGYGDAWRDRITLRWVHYRIYARVEDIAEDDGARSAEDISQKWK